VSLSGLEDHRMRFAGELVSAATEGEPVCVPGVAAAELAGIGCRGLRTAERLLQDRPASGGGISAWPSGAAGDAC
jgi:hypothetical protein